MKFKFVTYVSTAAVLPGLLMASQPAFAITSLADKKKVQPSKFFSIIIIDGSFRRLPMKNGSFGQLLSKLKIMAKEELTLD
ncbi:hypothetical protein [Bacillus spizizenii]|uniref:hypothetical protein n=1 Tax=Bacillus spizizenii TaxID=96241 RepID=UPI001F62548C|nr:hypothetical protein [Bacillus spizizenii]MCI4167776.1 hypothetical protein [Bacillus spizizenii]